MQEALKKPSSSSKNDKTIFLSLKKYQDKEAFMQAYDSYFDQIFRFIFFKIGQKEEAQDLTSATFLKCWGYVQEGKLRSEKEYQSLRSFLYKIARNLVIDHYRQARPQISLEDVENEIGDFGELFGLIEQSQELEFISAKLKDLKSEYRNILVLRYVNDLSISEIADILEKTKGNIRVTLYRATEALKNLTCDYDREGTPEPIK